MTTIRGLGSAVLVLLGGCATLPEVAPDAARFPQEVVIAEGRLPMSIALLVPPTVEETTVEVQSQLRMPAGRIVERALLVALRDDMQGAIGPLPAPPALADGYGATLEIVSVRYDYSQSLKWMVPVPLPFPFTFAFGEFEASTRLAFDLSLLDAQGRRVWTRTYDDGERLSVWPFPTFEGESWRAGIGRFAHEAAWRLSKEVLHDLRGWVTAERMKPREL